MAAPKRPSPIDCLVESDAVREAARALIRAVEDERAARTLSARHYAKSIRELERLRGRPLIYPMLASGEGRGARVWMADGSMKLDLIGGIGVYARPVADADYTLVYEHA